MGEKINRLKKEIKNETVKKLQQTFPEKPLVNVENQKPKKLQSELHSRKTLGIGDKVKAKWTDGHFYDAEVQKVTEKGLKKAMLKIRSPKNFNQNCILEKHWELV